MKKLLELLEDLFFVLVVMPVLAFVWVMLYGMDEDLLGVDEREE